MGVTPMIIKARGFEPCKGTVYVVTYSGSNPADNVAQGVFKTLKAANKLKATIESNGSLAAVRVGHFLPSGDIETI
jgi:hypothetical protein